MRTVKEEEKQYRSHLKDKKRVVVKIGTSSLNYPRTGELNLQKLEELVRVLSDLRNRGLEVALVTSGAIAVGRKAMGLKECLNISEKQACAAVGQARLMMVYQKVFAEYNQIAAQILMTKDTMLDNLARRNCQNTFQELLKMGAIPIVNENDTVSTYEMQFGDNDTLSAIVAALLGADLLILLSDIDGLFTDDPHQCADAAFIGLVKTLDDDLLRMGKSSTGTSYGTGGMATKLTAARIATASGADMVVANGKDVRVIHRILEGEQEGTLFLANKDEDFYIADYIEESIY